jgi:hypothetical protein
MSTHFLLCLPTGAYLAADYLSEMKEDSEMSSEGNDNDRQPN